MVLAATALRHWKLIGLGLLLLALGVQSYRLNSARVTIASQETELVKKSATIRARDDAISRQNAVIREMARISAERAREQAEGLREARRQNEAVPEQNRRLRQGSVTPRTPDQPCSISEALREVENSL